MREALKDNERINVGWYSRKNLGICTYCMSRHYTYIQAIENVIPTHQGLEDLQ